MKISKTARIIAIVMMLVGIELPFAPALAAGSNLIANPSAEISVAGTPSSWLQGHWGTNTPTFSYTSTSAEDGTHALSLTVAGYVDGDAKWYFAPVAVTGGTQYSFSDYYQSTVASSVIVQTDDGAGNYSYTDPINLPASSAWAPASINFTAPVGAKNICSSGVACRLTPVPAPNRHPSPSPGSCRSVV